MEEQSFSLSVARDGHSLSVIGNTGYVYDGLMRTLEVLDLGTLSILLHNNRVKLSISIIMDEKLVSASWCSCSAIWSSGLHRTLSIYCGWNRFEYENPILINSKHK